VEIHIINGPNLNLLGTREPETYGNENMQDCIADLKNIFSNCNLQYYQSNVEGELINYIQQHGFSANGFIINPGGYTHTSVAIADSIRAVTTPCIEVHLTNIFAREDYRKAGITTSACIGSISGFGLAGYGMALAHFVK
jgi:3-dehydroquinate dehydratase II